MVNLTSTSGEKQECEPPPSSPPTGMDNLIGSPTEVFEDEVEAEYPLGTYMYWPLLAEARGAPCTSLEVVIEFLECVSRNT